MATLREAQQRAKNLTPQKVNDDLFQFIRSIEEELVAYNVATLNKDSQSVDGKPIGFYSKATELITGGEKAEGEPFTLLDTGDFLESLFAKVDKNSILFGASDPKLFEILKNTLTDNLFGLQDQDLKRVINERISPFFKKYFIKNLG